MLTRYHRGRDGLTRRQRCEVIVGGVLAVVLVAIVYIGLT